LKARRYILDIPVLKETAELTSLALATIHDEGGLAGGRIVSECPTKCHVPLDRKLDSIVKFRRGDGLALEENFERTGNGWGGPHTEDKVIRLLLHDKRNDLTGGGEIAETSVVRQRDWSRWATVTVTRDNPTAEDPKGLERHDGASWTKSVARRVHDQRDALRDVEPELEALRLPGVDDVVHAALHVRVHLGRRSLPDLETASIPQRLTDHPLSCVEICGRWH